MSLLGMTFAKFFPSDWRTGCMVLNLEEEGLYIRVVAYMYDTGNPIPGDDREASRLLNVQIQKYEKVMAALIDKGKMFRAQGWIINERVMAELDKWKLERVARSEAARKREADRKTYLQRLAEPPEVPPHQPPHLPGGGSLGGAPHQPHDVPQGVTGQNTNKLNGSHSTAVPQAEHGSGTNLEARSQKPEKEKKARGNSPVGEPPSSPTKSDAEWALAAFNVVAQQRGLPKAEKLTPDREQKIKARLHFYGRVGWERALDNLGRSAFLQGKNDRGWRANLEFILQASSFNKLHDGGYGNGAHAAPVKQWYDQPDATDAEWERMIDAHAGEMWPPILSGAPGHRDCRVPKHIVQRRRLTEIYDERGLKRRSA